MVGGYRVGSGRWEGTGWVVGGYRVGSGRVQGG